MDAFIPLKEAAKQTSQSEGTIMSWVRNGNVASRKTRGNLLVNLSDIYSAMPVATTTDRAKKDLDSAKAEYKKLTQDYKEGCRKIRASINALNSASKRFENVVSVMTRLIDWHKGHDGSNTAILEQYIYGYSYEEIADQFELTPYMAAVEVSQQLQSVLSLVEDKDYRDMEIASLKEENQALKDKLTKKEDKNSAKSRLLRKHIRGLKEISIYRRNALIRADIGTIGSLVKHSAAELDRIPRFGKIGRKEIQKYLETLGLELSK